jgi:cadmium resistance protein CadD (predicted permease)
VSIGLIGQAVGLFAVTNIDDIVILALFFGDATSRSGALRVVAGQYVGFAGILAAAIVGALGAGLLPEMMIPYLGLLPLLLGLRAAWVAWAAWREYFPRSNGADHADKADRDGDISERSASGPGVFTVAAVTVANGGDNIGVYVPVFTTTGTGGLLTYVLAFLVLVAVWCAVGVPLRRAAPRCESPVPVGAHPVADRPDRHRIDHPRRGPCLRPLRPTRAAAAAMRRHGNYSRSSNRVCACLGRVRCGQADAGWDAGGGAVRGEPPSRRGAAATLLMCGLFAAPRVLPVLVSRPVVTTQ